MALISRKRQTTKYRIYLLYTCFIVIIISIIYFLFTSQYIFMLRDFYVTSGRIRRSRNLTRIDWNFSQPSFQSQLPSYYPHFPIHIDTQNLTSLQNTSKLILLGNSWFGDQNWGIGGIEKSSQELMTQLSCPFLNNYCHITNDKSLFADADAVIYHMRDGINLREARKYRQPEQRFVFVLWESPTYTPDLTRYNRFFNWTMTYRLTSHIVASYYLGSSYLHTSSNYYKLMIEDNVAKNLSSQVKKLDHQLSDEILAKKKLGTTAALISNCGGTSRRLLFIKHLKRYIDVKVYGQCGEPCPKNVDCRQYIAENYYFFLSFENSLCTDYTTEKFFSTLQYPIVPVVLGRSNYSQFIPSSGFIDTNDFANVSSLADHLKQVRQNKEKYLSYFTWKQDYVWGFTQFMTPICDLCVRLHLDTTPNIIDNIDGWWKGGACQKPRIFKLV